MRQESVLFGLIALLAAGGAAAAPPPIEAFGRIPQIDNVALSPDGKYLAWEDNTTPVTTFVVFDLSAGKQKATLPFKSDTKMHDIMWADADTVLLEVGVTVRRRGNRWYTIDFQRVISVDIETGKSRMLLNSDPDQAFVTGAAILALRSPKAGSIVMESWNFQETQESGVLDTRMKRKRADSGWIRSVYNVDASSGKEVIAEHGSNFTDDWAVDAQGRTVARADWYPERNRFVVLAKDGAGWRDIHELKNGDRLDLVGVSADGTGVLAIGANGEDRVKLWSIALDGSGARPLVEHPQFGVLHIIRDPLTFAPIAVNFDSREVDTHWLDARAEKRHKAVLRSFPGSEVWVAGRSEDYKRMIVQVEAPTKPPVYYLVDFTTGKADIVGEAYPKLSGVKLGEVRVIEYKARDGWRIPAYLTLPPGMEEKNLPFVILPHGGPESHDDLEFDWWAQFLASRGYAVLQPQFRGSTGFGEAHRKAGYRQWGLTMQDDVTDGVKAMIEMGLADPRRICIAGWSYGGYAALAGAAFTPDLYACAASVAGVSDLPSMLGFEEREAGEESDTVHYWQNHIGSRDDPNVIAKSPARSASTFKAPVLLLHGADDTVVPIIQSQKMHDALVAARKPVKLVKLVGEGHGLSRSENRMQLLTELEAFLATHLAPKTEAVAGTTP